MGPRRHGQRRGAALPHSAAMTPRTAKARTPLGGSPLCSACSTAWPAPMSGSMAAGGRSAGRPGHPGTSRHGPLRAGGQDSATPSGGSSVRSSRWYRRGPVPGGARLRLRRAGRHRRDHLPARRPRRAGRRDRRHRDLPRPGLDRARGGRQTDRLLERGGAAARAPRLPAPGERQPGLAAIAHIDEPPRFDPAVRPAAPGEEDLVAGLETASGPAPQTLRRLAAAPADPAWPLPPPTRAPRRQTGAHRRHAGRPASHCRFAPPPTHATASGTAAATMSGFWIAGCCFQKLSQSSCPNGLWKHSSPVGSVPFSGLSSTYP